MNGQLFPSLQHTLSSKHVLNSPILFHLVFYQRKCVLLLALAVKLTDNIL